jgi:LPS sulfotransferase NodH
MRLMSHEDLINSLSAPATGKSYAKPDRRCIVILFTPYAANKYLADMLTKDGRFGYPSEYFNHDVIKFLLPDLRPATVGDYLNAVETVKASPQGVFSILITMGDIRRFETLDFFDRYKDATFVSLRRRNIVEQAIALFLSLKPELADNALKREYPDGDYSTVLERLLESGDVLREIKDWCAHILNYEMSAELEIAKRSIAVDRILYEELIGNPARVLDQFYALLDLERVGGDAELICDDDAHNFLNVHLQQSFLAGFPDFVRRVHAIRPPLVLT